MKEIIADLRMISDSDGDKLVDHGIIQQLESTLLDYAGKVIKIKITEIKDK